MNDREASKRVDISVIVTAHDEGRIAHRTMRSVQAAIDEAAVRGIQCEMIVALDHPSAETAEYFTRWKETAQVLCRVDSNSDDIRNQAVAKAQGKFVAILDAASLLGRDWLHLCYGVAIQSAVADVVVHAEYTLEYGNTYEVTRHPGSVSPQFNRWQLLNFEYWTSLLFAPRALHLKIPFASLPPDSGFGHSARHWVCEVLASGGVVSIASGACTFIRQGRAVSTHASSSKVSEILPPSQLFEPCRHVPSGSRSAPSTAEVAKEAATPTSPPVRHVIKGYLKSVPQRVSRMTEDYPLIQKPLGYIYRAVVGNERKGYLLPPNVLTQWKCIAEIEPQLFPDTAALAELSEKITPSDPTAAIYAQICEQLGSFRASATEPQFTHVYLMPWLKRGGAELEAIHYINLVAANSAHRVLVVITDGAECPWKTKLNDSVQLLDMFTLTKNLKWRDRLRLLLNLLVQLRPRVIHLIYSSPGTELFASHGRALSLNSHLYSSAFNCDQDSEGKLTGYMVDQLPRYADHVTGILSDNRTFLSFLERTYGINPARLFVHYQPAAMLSQDVHHRVSSSQLRVLWAGRLDRQKRPDLLLEIAKRCQDANVHFHVYGSSILSWDKAEVDFKSAPNITYHGPFDGLHSLDTTQFDLFLMTSQFEGMPNILLEAASAGLAIVSSNVGGISEFIEDGVSGILIAPFDNVEHYVAAIKQLMNDADLRKRFVTNGRSVLARQHSRSEFEASVERLPGYLLNPQQHSTATSSLQGQPDGVRFPVPSSSGRSA